MNFSQVPKNWNPSRREKIAETLGKLGFTETTQRYVRGTSLKEEAGRVAKGVGIAGTIGAAAAAAVAFPVAALYSAPVIAGALSTGKGREAIAEFVNPVARYETGKKIFTDDFKQKTKDVAIGLGAGLSIPLIISGVGKIKDIVSNNNPPANNPPDNTPHVPVEDVTTGSPLPDANAVPQGVPTKKHRRKRKEMPLQQTINQSVRVRVDSRSSANRITKKYLNQQIYNTA